MICLCGEIIKDDTDDNYNSSHTEIFCHSCGRWFKVDICKSIIQKEETRGEDVN